MFNWITFLKAMIPDTKQYQDQWQLVRYRYMNNSKYTKFVHFLEEDLKIPTNAITLAWRKSEQSVIALPMILWQYGLVSVQQLEKIWDWLDNSPEIQGNALF